MRVAVVNWSSRKVGGVESYLETVLPALSSRGHQLCFLQEHDAPENYRPIVLPESTAVLSVATMGPSAAVAALRDWAPDLVFTHGVFDPELEESVLLIAPAVFFAHVYAGCCVSGLKSFKVPVARPCSRKFDWGCLLHYYPHRCGGLNPLTMFREFHVQKKRKELLHRYRAVVTNSHHMRQELGRYDLSAHVINLPVVEGPATVEKKATETIQLLFLGRMDRLKGGLILLDALPRVCKELRCFIKMVFAGDGPERELWQRRAWQITRNTGQLGVEFVGWVDDQNKERLFAETDLLVIPSLWPEPFGLSGLEAGIRNIPVAAFAVGGIPEWLENGVNGFTASAEPPTASGLAKAIIDCLIDRSRFAQLRLGAKQVAESFSLERHVSALLSVFEQALGSS